MVDWGGRSLPVLHDDRINADAAALLFRSEPRPGCDTLDKSSAPLAERGAEHVQRGAANDVSFAGGRLRLPVSDDWAADNAKAPEAARFGLVVGHSISEECGMPTCRRTWGCSLLTINVVDH